MLVLGWTKDGEVVLEYSVLLENLRYSEANRPRDDCHSKKGVTIPRRRWLGEWALGWMVCTPFNELFIISRNWLVLGGAALQGQMSKHQNIEHKSRGEYGGAGGGT